MLLMLDNYDSFTFNLVQYLEELGQSVDVIRNDQATVQQILDLKPKKIVVSPGPCTSVQHSAAMWFAQVK